MLQAFEVVCDVIPGFAAIGTAVQAPGNRTRSKKYRGAS